MPLQDAKSRSLGYAHWPEQPERKDDKTGESRSLGYAHWPELPQAESLKTAESRSLGYAHWPEQCHKPIAAAR